jgi:O-antigen/teichoic acid export membrane protein
MRRRQRRLDIIGIVFGFIFLIILWVQCISYLRTVNFFGHENYFGQPIDTLLLLTLLIIITPISFVASWRTIFRKKRAKHKITEKSLWMDEQSWKFPWE